MKQFPGKWSYPEPHGRSGAGEAARRLRREEIRKVDLDSDFGHDDRQTTPSDIPWIELFIDLVFIAALIQAGDRLIRHLGLAGLAEFTVFFALLWWVWSSLTIHFARRDRDDVAARLIVFMFVFAVGNLGVLAGRGVLAHSAAFALFYALARFSLAALYADLAWRDAKARPLAMNFAIGFSFGALLWAASAFIPEPWRFGFWVFAIAAEMATGWLHDKKDLRAHLSLDASRLSERYGQLTLIVLGESFIKIIASLVEGPGITFEGTVMSIFALVFTAAVFWAYFGDVAGSTIREGRARLWTYLHLPLMMSIAALGVALHPIVVHETGKTIEPIHHLLLHICAMAVFFWLAMIDLFARTSDARGGYGAAVARLASVGLLGLSWLLGGGLNAMAAVGLAAAACTLPVLFENMRRPHVGAGTRASVEKEREPGLAQP
jgi:low temperature requirement protein LtrA